MPVHRTHLTYKLVGRKLVVAALAASIAFVLILGASTPAAAQAPAASPTITPGTATTPPQPPPPEPPAGDGMRLLGPGASVSPAASAAPPLTPEQAGRAPAAPPRAASDPTMPGPAIRELIEQGNVQRNTAAAPSPNPGVPEVRIRARVFAKDKEPVAVLEIGGRSLTVRLNSEIHIPPSAESPAGTQLRVVELSPTELRLEVLKRNQIISLN